MKGLAALVVSVAFGVQGCASGACTDVGGFDGVGVYGGLRAPWGTKHPQVKEGIAMRANSENDLVMFDAEDGTQLTLYADNLWWETDSAGGGR